MSSATLLMNVDDNRDVIIRVPGDDSANLSEGVNGIKPNASPHPELAAHVATRSRWKAAARKVNAKLSKMDSHKLDQKAMHVLWQQRDDFGDLARNFKDMLHPKEKVFKGGEGVARIVQARENDLSCGPIRDKYWSQTLFSITGRSLPVGQWLWYMVYTCIVVTLVVGCMPNYAASTELRGMSTALTTLGTALFLLMTFRTNNSYDRWWEGRKQWDNIMARCLDFGRVAQMWIAPKDRDIASEVIRLTIAYSLVVKKYLRMDWKDLHELNQLLPRKVVKQLERDSNPVQRVCMMLTAAISNAGAFLPAVILSGADVQIRSMILDTVACNRIYHTPMPFAYIVHLRSFIVLWLLMLPWAFLPTMGYYTIALCAVIAYQVFGFEDIGVEIEQPFGTDYNDLPVDKLQAYIFNQLIRCLDEIHAPHGDDKNRADVGGCDGDDDGDAADAGADAGAAAAVGAAAGAGGE